MQQPARLLNCVHTCNTPQHCQLTSHGLLVLASWCGLLQSLAVPALLSGGDFLLCAQTGSGKTLAYMLPIVQMLKQLEAEQEGYVRRPKRPKVVVLGPTKELTDQVRAGQGRRSRGGRPGIQSCKTEGGD